MFINQYVIIQFRWTKLKTSVTFHTMFFIFNNKHKDLFITANINRLSHKTDSHFPDADQNMTQF